MTIPNPQTNNTQPLNLLQWQKRGLKEKETIENWIINQSNQLTYLEILAAKEKKIEQLSDIIVESDRYKWVNSYEMNYDNNLFNFINEYSAKLTSLEVLTGDSIQSELN